MPVINKKLKLLTFEADRTKRGIIATTKYVVVLLIELFSDFYTSNCQNARVKVILFKNTQDSIFHFFTIAFWPSQLPRKKKSVDNIDKAKHICKSDTEHYILVQEKKKPNIMLGGKIHLRQLYYLPCSYASLLH